MADKQNVTIHSSRTAYKGRYAIDEVDFSFDRVSRPGRIEHARREIFQRGDSAAALLHDVERDVVIVTEQFRLPTYAHGPGYLLEAAAGSIDEGEDPADCVRRELLEETGYKAGKLTRICAYYSSPGASSEKVFLYYAPVRPADLVDPAASGVEADNEDIRRVEFPREEFLDKLSYGDFEDGKIIVAGLWLKTQPRKGKPAAR
ncbi:MAG: NUDIX domain-containing protein [Alphaproteobacteria bacterium]|nr:NUDIX domain-containing protein [Alphaproteobacteria bacterium]